MHENSSARIIAYSIVVVSFVLLISSNSWQFFYAFSQFSWASYSYTLPRNPLYTEYVARFVFSALAALSIGALYRVTQAFTNQIVTIAVKQEISKPERILFASIPIVISIVGLFSFSFVEAVHAYHSHLLVLCATLFITQLVIKYSKHKKIIYIYVIIFIMALSGALHAYLLLLLPIIVASIYSMHTPPKADELVLSSIISFAIIILLYTAVIPLYERVFIHCISFLQKNLHLPLLCGTAIIICTFVSILYTVHVLKNKILTKIISAVLVFFISISISAGYKHIIIHNQQDTHIIKAPLFIGTHYTAPQTTAETKEFNIFLPRLWDKTQAPHYAYWAGIEEGKNTIAISHNGSTYNYPTQEHNARFFWKYQCWHDYFRYVLWNISGIQNDEISKGEPHKGNWLSGFYIIDSTRLGDYELMQRPVYNTIYAIPLLLCVIGIIFILFFRPYYVYISLLAIFCVSIGLIVFRNASPAINPYSHVYTLQLLLILYIYAAVGIVAIIIIIKKIFGSSSLYIVPLFLLIIIVLVLAQHKPKNTHTRITTSLEFAEAALNQCKDSSIYICASANEYNSMRYVQLSKALRTDITLINSSMLYEHVSQGRYNEQTVITKSSATANSSIKLFAHTEHRYILADIMQQIRSYISANNPQAETCSITSYKTAIYLNRNAIQKNYPYTQHYTIPNYLEIDIFPSQTNTIKYETLCLLEFIANYDFNRPVYFSAQSVATLPKNLQSYMYATGLQYEFIPIISENIAHKEFLRTSYKKFVWTQPSQCTAQQERAISLYRKQAVENARILASHNDSTAALSVLHTCMAQLPMQLFSTDAELIAIAEAFAAHNSYTDAEYIYKQILELIDSKLLYYQTIPYGKKHTILPDVLATLQLSERLYRAALHTNNRVSMQSISYINLAFIEKYVSFARQITICLPEEFFEKNQWVYNLQTNMQYIAQWYNFLKFNTLSQSYIQTI